MRLIDADALIERLKYSFHDHERVSIETVTGCFLTEFCSPTIDPEELRPKGRWVVSGCGFDTCSECRKVYSDGWFSIHGYKPRMRFNFCPNCGADMRGKDHAR